MASAGRTPTDPVAWMTTVARRRYVDLVRRESRRRALQPATDELDRTCTTPEQVVVEREHAQWLAAQLRALPDATRSVCSQAGSGTPRTEIAEQLGITARATESHLTRARRFIRGKAALGWAVVAVPAARWLRGHFVAGATMAGVVAAAGSLFFLPVEDTDAAPPTTGAATGPPAKSPHPQERAGTIRIVPASSTHRLGSTESRTAQSAPARRERPAQARIPASPQIPRPQRPSVLHTLPLDVTGFRHDVSAVGAGLAGAADGIDPCVAGTGTCG